MKEKVFKKATLLLLVLFVIFGNLYLNVNWVQAAGDITLSVQNDSSVTIAEGAGYGPELISDEAGSAYANPGIEIYFTEYSTGEKAGHVNTYSLDFMTGGSGIGIFHSSELNKSLSYWSEPNETGKMVIRKTDGSYFDFKEIQLMFGNNVILVIEGFKGGVSTGTVDYNVNTVTDTALASTLDSTVLTPSIFQNVDKVTITGRNYNGTTEYDNRLDTGGIVFTKLITIGDPVLPDTTTPTLLSAARDSNTQITVTLSEASQNLIKANSGGFTVFETGNPGTTYGVSATAQGLDSSHVVLTVADLGVSAAQGLTVTYTAGVNGTIQDLAGNALATDGTGVTIALWDNTAPTVSSINRQTPVGASTNATSVIYRVTFSEAVSGVDTTDFTLTTTGTVSGNIASVSAASGTTMDVTVNSISGVGTLGLDLNAAATGIADIGGTAIATGYTSGEAYTVDTIAPTLQSAVRNNDTQITVTLSEASQNLINSDGFTVFETGNPGTTYFVTYTEEGLDYRHVVLSVYDLGGSAAKGLTVTYTTGPSATIRDLAGNLLATDGTGVTIALWDNTAPTVSSINRQTPVGASTNATSVIYRVTFSEAVSGVDTTDFTLTTTGTVSGNIASVSAASGTTMDVTVNSISGVGTLGLDLNAAATGIADIEGTAIAAGYTSGEVYTVDTTAPISSGSSSTRSTTTQPSQGTVVVIVNGNAEDAGKETKTTEDGKSTVTVEVNNTVIKSKIDEAIKNNTTGAGNVIQVPVSDTKSEVVKVELTGDIVKKLEENNFDVSIKKHNIEYIIPAEEFTISNIADNFGVKETELIDIKVEVKIIKLDASVIEKYNEVANANGAELVFPPVSFEVVAKTTKKDGSSEEVGINKFNNYVERVMEIPEGIDPSQITTGIVFSLDGTYSHVPTEVFQKDGKWYAKLNSLTNSNYSVIWNPITVRSVENHWAKDAVNDMAARLVIFDSEKFEPNKAITRADFAEYIVRALGLYREGSKHENNFKDVSSAGERTLAILIANEYGIINGYTDETFRPDQQITREEAMAMYQRAMKITKLTGSDTTRYQNYTDYETVSSWAKTYVKEVVSAHVFNGTGTTTISPKANLTYAEAAQAIKNLLVESKLINK